MIGLTQAQRDRIDAALVDIYRAAWEVGRELWPEPLRAAYMQGRVDQELGRPLTPQDVPAPNHERRLV